MCVCGGGCSVGQDYEFPGRTSLLFWFEGLWRTTWFLQGSHMSQFLWFFLFFLFILFCFVSGFLVLFVCFVFCLFSICARLLDRETFNPGRFSHGTTLTCMCLSLMRWLRVK